MADWTRVIDVHFFESVLQRERVDDSRQHAHVVGGNTIETLCACGKTSKDIAATDHDTDLNTEAWTSLISAAMRLNNFGIDTEACSPIRTSPLSLSRTRLYFASANWKPNPQHCLHFTAEVCAAFFETFAGFESGEPADANVLADFTDQRVDQLFDRL